MLWYPSTTIPGLRPALWTGSFARLMRRTTRPPRPGRTPHDGPGDSPRVRVRAPAWRKKAENLRCFQARDVIVGERAVRHIRVKQICAEELRGGVHLAAAHRRQVANRCARWPPSPLQSTAMPIAAPSAFARAKVPAQSDPVSSGCATTARTRSLLKSSFISSSQHNVWRLGHEVGDGQHRIGMQSHQGRRTRRGDRPV